ncbi:hypothetical protein HYU22_02455 [Candidatus Woesearchaeota archaeon]|nr:hypothetical protein [Candidatus Woesearchaeota archaeon]
MPRRRRKISPSSCLFPARSCPELEKQVLSAVSTPTTQCRRLSHCVKKGIAFHHAGLVQQQRELIEEGFKRGNVKIICCTPTLAAGISTPAFRVIIKSLKRFSGQWGMDWIPVLEYMQMAGRAGRPEFGDRFGEAITIAKDEREKEEIYNKYICGVPEDIYSKLAVEPVLRTYLLSLIASGIIRDNATMTEFFGRTFWAHQFKDMEKLNSIMEKMITLLAQWKFVDVQESGGRNEFIPAKKLGTKAERTFRPTLLGKRISELYLDPLTARHLLDCVARYTEQKNSFSLLQMVCHTLEMRPLLTIKSSEEDRIQEELVRRCNTLLEDEPSAYDPEYDDFISSIKTALFFEAWISEHDEEYLLDNYTIRPGEIKAKLDRADWLLYSAAELCVLQQEKATVRELAKLRIRVKNGVKEELLPLLKLKGIGRVRSRRLYTNGIRELGDVRTADLTTLSQLLGRLVAEDVKRQLGEEIEEIAPGTRKGQLSMEKFSAEKIGSRSIK